jgi:murein DD-endopeptidase MepM/ murein hydrolase activator NlpD
MTAAKNVRAKLDDVLAERERVLAAYHEASRNMTEAEHSMALSEERIARNREIMAEVHAQVLRLQGELARIDARLREKAERDLIRLGLLDTGVAQHGSTGTQFNWPVYGSVSAGFHNSAYQKNFGVPHEGADIVVAQGTPVASAADGVVFTVRDGGATGYSYILIGHRDGYATLYGHLSVLSVKAGQEVSKGAIIGLSGGTPGTRGAGPMTTGPHLHFELIKGGVNIDPLGVLP